VCNIAAENCTKEKLDHAHARKEQEKEARRGERGGRE
jgi:hypothetical protein